MNAAVVAASAFGALAAAQAQSAAAAPRPTVDAAWARPTVSGQSTGGAYLRIVGGAVDDRLLSVRTAAARSAELHTMEMDGSVMRMRAVDVIAVPAGKVVELKPGGRHLMLVGLAQPLRSGASFPLTLRFEKAGEVAVDVKVGAAPAAAAHSTGTDHKH